MIDQKQITKISKFLSLVLRHQPETIGITLDESGWVQTETLIKKMCEHGKKINLELLTEVVNTNDKKRFAFNDDKSAIRANQGHSVAINLGYQQKTPPEILYHGTAAQNTPSIFKSGLKKQQRHHVHLSTNQETAIKVGQRYGKPVVLKILSREMHNDGFEFFESDNKVWLTDHVPVNYITTE